MPGQMININGTDEFVIDVDLPSSHDVMYPKDKGRGHDPSQVRKTMQALPTELKLPSKSDWSALIKENKERQSNILDVCGDIVQVLDQGQVGYCWSHSTTHTVMFERCMAHQPYVPLSAYAVAATIKKGRDEGGWCGLSAEFAKDKGIPSQKIWPQGDRNYRNYDKPETWADAAKHIVVEDWVDTTVDVYDRNLKFEVIAGLLLLYKKPLAVDFNFWSHSVCAVEVVEVEPGSFGLKIRNSWGSGWGDKGNGVLRGNQAIPDGAICIRTTLPSLAA